jgi:hypothetical protein
MVGESVVVENGEHPSQGGNEHVGHVAVVIERGVDA